MSLQSPPGYDPASLPEHLRHFYQHVFPAELMVRWLSYGTRGGGGKSGGEAVGSTPADHFPRREWSFTSRDDVYTRYRCFEGAPELRKALVEEVPYKIDIGAVFTLPPREHASVKSGGFAPVERELVFDIDMTDYDGTRTCCTGASICEKCWPFMTAAVRVIDAVLEAEFGFEHRLWVYSGRRGVHCWIADERARGLSNAARTALVEYLAVYTGNENNKSKTQVTAPLLPFMRRVYDSCLRDIFASLILNVQDCFAGAKGAEKLLDQVPYDDLADEMRSRWSSSAAAGGAGTESARRWAELEPALAARGPAGERAVHDIVFTYTFPRIDVNVSTHRNHLLKSPFCVHPKTGRVCVVFEARDAGEFNPFDLATVPHVAQFVDEIAAFDKENPGAAAQTPAWAKTALGKSVKTLESFLKAILLKARTANLEQRQQQNMDW